MKTVKNKYLALIIVLIIGVLSYGFISKKLFKTIEITSEPNTEILGFWVLENDSTTKIEFLSDGQLKRYENNVLTYTEQYYITNSCDGETLSNGDLFLKTIDEDNIVDCCYINGINENDSGILSLTTSGQGKVVIYVRP